MAACAKCGTKYGCSCQLKSGLCPSCYSVKLQQAKINDKPKTK